MDAGIKTEQEKLQPEATNAKKALETAIPRGLQRRPAPMDGMLGLVRFPRARPPLPVSRNPKSSNPFGGTKCFRVMGRALSVE
jgi:hypothetical protein